MMLKTTIYVLSLVLQLASNCPAQAKDIGEALADMGLQDTDPRGVTLMVACICLLLCLAGALIFTTLRLGRKKSTDKQ